MRILIVEDHPAVAEGHRTILLRHHEVIGVVGNGLEVIPFLAAHAVDLVLLDLGLPGRNGLQVLDEIKAIPNPPRVLIVSVHYEAALVTLVRERHADGFVSKLSDAAGLLEAIGTIASGSTAFSDAPGKTRASRLAPDLTLTWRQMDVLQCVPHGFLRKQIADWLYLRESTVDQHLSALRLRLGAGSNAELVMNAIEHGFLSSFTPLPQRGGRRT